MTAPKRQNAETGCPDTWNGEKLLCRQLQGRTAYRSE